MDLHATYKQRALEEMRRLSQRWGLLLALGIILVLAGVAALGATVVATLATVVFLGAVLLVAGGVDIVSAFAARGWPGWGMALLSGVLAAVVGGLLIARPAVGAGVLTLLLAAMLLAAGIGRIVVSLAERFQGWGWSLASGLAGAILGFLVVAEFPTSAFWFLGIVVAVELLFRGTTWIGLAFTLHRAKGHLEEEARHAPIAETRHSAAAGAP